MPPWSTANPPCFLRPQPSTPPIQAIHRPSPNPMPPLPRDPAVPFRTTAGWTRCRLHRRGSIATRFDKKGKRKLRRKAEERPCPSDIPFDDASVPVQEQVDLAVVQLLEAIGGGRCLDVLDLDASSVALAKILSLCRRRGAPLKREAKRRDRVSPLVQNSNKK